MLKSVQHNPVVFNVNVDKLKPLEKWIMKIEGQILDGLIFDVCIVVYNHHYLNRSTGCNPQTDYFYHCICFIELCETDV